MNANGLSKRYLVTYYLLSGLQRKAAKIGWREQQYSTIHEISIGPW